MKKSWLWGGIGGLLSFAIPPTLFVGLGNIYWGIWGETLHLWGVRNEFAIILASVICFIVGAILGLAIGSFIKNTSINKAVSVGIVVYVIVFMISMVVLIKLNTSVSESRMNDFLTLKNSINSGIGSADQMMNDCNTLEVNYATLCIEQLALRQKDPLICKSDPARFPNDGVNCITNLFKANPSFKDATICESFSNTNEKGACIQGVAVNILDSSLCSQAGYYADGCRLIVKELKKK